MAYFVIAGKPDCQAFVHAIEVARYLQENLPHFEIRTIQKKVGDWEPWLEEINSINKWHHSYSPLIWKELSMRGGIPHYVGGLSEFWEYCYDYYGLESILSPDNLKDMVECNMQYFQEMEKRKKEEQKHIRQVGILGTYSSPILIAILTELLEMKHLQKSCGIQIKLYDFESNAEENIEIVEDLIENITPIATNGDLQVLTVVEKMQDILTDCDLLIVIGDYSRRDEEDETDWLVRNMSVMYMLADEINVFSKRSLRIILALDGPICFNATTLIDTCTKVRVQNIVAITSDVGLGPLKWAAEQANINLEDLSAPPVWGFIGINEFVDLRSAIICSDIYRPYQRVIRNKGGSTLPLGVIETELRYAAYLIEKPEKALEAAKNAREIIKQQLLRAPLLAKVRALKSLLRLWYATEPSDDIISLGICSNGSHGIPAGICFSQPAILNRKMWVPFKDFPLTEKAQVEISQLLPTVTEISEKMNIGPFMSQRGSFQTGSSYSRSFTNVQ